MWKAKERPSTKLQNMKSIKQPSNFIQAVGTLENNLLRHNRHFRDLFTQQSQLPQQEKY